MISHPISSPSLHLYCGQTPLPYLPSSPYLPISDLIECPCCQIPSFWGVWGISYTPHIIMQVISDYFQDTAYRLGYRPEDLLPITREAVEAESTHITRNMGERERDYYINKKLVTLVQRQNKIVAEVEKEIKKKELSFKVAPAGSPMHNPAVVRLLNEHHKIIQRNIKFLDTLQRSQEIQSRRLQRLSVTSSNDRKQERTLSNHSSASRRSNNSMQSAQSNRSSASSKQRLQLVRSRQKEEEKVRRALLREKEQENSRKSLKAQEEALKKSQRARTRSQINKQIVDENRKDLRFMHNAQIKDHFERLKFKLQKTQQIRVKNAERREQQEQTRSYKLSRIQQKRQSQQASKRALAQRYDQKFRTVSMRLENQGLVKKQSRRYNELTESLKINNAKKNRELMARQQQQFATALRKNEQKRLQTAELNRYSFTGETRLKHITQEVRQELAKKNVQDLKQRRALQSEAVQRKLRKKFDEIGQIQAVKCKLQAERGQVIRQLNLQRRTLDSRRDKTKFNSFFDI